VVRKDALAEPVRGGALVSEENFLRYRLQVVQKMADGPLKSAIVTAIGARAESLRQTHRPEGTIKLRDWTLNSR
jgi:hypothetical protein